MPKAKARTKKVVTETFEDEAEAAPERTQWSEADLDDGSESQVAAILDGLGPGDIKIKISKQNPKGGWAYCFSTEGDIDEDFIQASFGGGRYLGKIFVNGIYRNSFQLNIAERVGGVPGAGGGMADLQLRMMQQMFDKMERLLDRQAQGTPVSEMAQAIETLSKINGGGSAGLGEKAVELLLKGLELGKSLGGDKGESWSEVIREALPVLGEVMKGRQRAAGNGAQQPEPQQRNSLPAADQSDVIREGIAYLKQKALRGGDPGLYIDWIADNASEAQYQAILHFILTSEFSALAEIDPEIAKPPFVEFFRAMYDGLRTTFSQADNLDVDSSGAAGNGGNTADNGASGKGGKPKSGAKKAG